MKNSEIYLLPSRIYSDWGFLGFAEFHQEYTGEGTYKLLSPHTPGSIDVDFWLAVRDLSPRPTTLT